MMIVSRSTGPADQQGAALMVGLMLLLVLTVAGISTMRNTTFQERMAANAQFHTTTFQGAESAIRRIVGEVGGDIAPPANQDNVLITAIDTTQTAPTRTVAVAGDQSITSSATVTYGGQQVAPGFSLGAGKAKIVAHQFNITATSSLPGAAAASSHQQGIQRVGPGL